MNPPEIVYYLLHYASEATPCREIVGAVN